MPVLGGAYSSVDVAYLGRWVTQGVPINRILVQPITKAIFLSLSINGTGGSYHRYHLEYT